MYGYFSNSGKHLEIVAFSRAKVQILFFYISSCTFSPILTSLVKVNVLNFGVRFYFFT